MSSENTEILNREGEVLPRIENDLNGFLRKERCFLKTKILKRNKIVTPSRELVS